MYYSNYNTYTIYNLNNKIVNFCLIILYVLNNIINKNMKTI